jgi:YD repeat-containing protein
MKIFQPILALLLPLKAMACGLDWSPPVSHFENVDYQGNVHIVRKIGEVEKLPLYLIFNSTFGNSPYVGSGFELPFLEARMWQVDEGRFQAKMPTGWLWIFQRTKDPTVLEGNAGWKGVIKDDTITAWAPCGDKIIFKTGRIVSMKIKEDLYSYNYRNGRVASVEKNGRSVLEIKRDAMTGEVTGLALPGTWETIGLAATAERPVVESIGGKNVVSCVEKTLGEVTPASGSGKVAFEQTVNGELNPTIKLGDQLITWSPATKKIIKDGEWTYEIKPGAGPFDNAAIGRENARNQSEFWHHDGAKGEEIVQGIDGVKKVTSWFTSGKLAGKIRKVEEIRGNVTNGLRQLSYNEEGRLVREVSGDGRAETFTYDQDGNRFSSSNPLPSSEELDRIEQTWRAIIESGAADNSKKQDALYDLALFYIGRRHESAKARDLAQLINNQQRRFNVILQSYDHDQSLTSEEKITHYQRLQGEYPNARERLDRLIQIRNNEI